MTDKGVNCMEYQVGGSLGYNNKTYIERTADKEIFKHLKKGILCYIFNSRQMGKSSLRVRTAEKLKAEGFVCIYINISDMGTHNVTSDMWYKSFIDSLIEGFKIDIDFHQWWSKEGDISSVKKLKKFIEKILLKRVDGSIAIFIDEIDSILSVKFPLDDFWATIRSCYESRNNNPEYQRLNFVIIGVTTPSELIQNIITTPFNIGQAIELSGFTSSEIEPLMQGLSQGTQNVNDFIEEILYWTGGQPFLTQKIFALIQSSNLNNLDDLQAVRDLIKAKIINRWDTQDSPSHLKTIQDRLIRSKNSIEILRLCQKIYGNKQIIYDEKSDLHKELRLSGLVVKDGNILKIYNHIYQQVFTSQWIEKEITSKGVIGSRYSIIKTIGRGGFSETFLVEDLDIEPHPLRTLKKLTPPLGLNDEQLKIVEDNFRREAGILAAFNHDRIPSVFNYFTENNQIFIVQTYIEGKTLEQELTELISSNGITEYKVIEILEEILEIVSFVHNRDVIHRDIKPSNLIRRDTNNKLVLIDFGSGKNIQGNMPTQSKPTLALGTDGYTPDEQWNGHAVSSSDLYAIGIIGIQALVDMIPSQYWLEKQHNGNLIWHNRDKIGASKELKNILDKMTCSRAEDRYQSAQEVLDKLGELKAKRKKLLQIALKRHSMWRNTKVSGVVILAMTALGLGLGSIKKLWEDRVDFNDYISSGDRPISLYESNTREQENGINYFKSKNYPQAYNTFYQLLRNHKSSFDPSLMIYMNNAKVRYLHQQNPNRPIYTIAITVPTDTPVGKQIVSGVAIAQNKVVNPQNIPINSGYSNLPPDIKKESDVYLEITIANDRNIRNNAAQLAEKLTKTITGEDGIQRSVIGVVGSYTSEVTCAALPVYSQANMPMISPTSSVEKLKDVGYCGGDPNNVFHRTISSSKFESQRLIERLKNLGNLQNIKITAFYKKGEKYEFSQDLFNHFQKDLQRNGGKIAREYDLREDNNYREIVQNIESSNTQNVIALFPDGGTENMLVFDRAQKVIENINPAKISLILGSNPLLSSTNVIKLQDLNNKLLVAVDWSDDPSCSNENFTSLIEKIIKGGFNRHLVSSYESTMALAEIFKDGANTPKEINDRLKNFRSKNFSDAYNNRYIGFNQNGDRTYIEHKILLTPTATQKRRGIAFKPLPNQCKL
jgi:serine/threonine protein kinase/ABC-type branched-subunit amino acid transport system substrate-binding protein